MIDKYVHVEMASYVYKGNQYHRCGTSQKRLLQLNFGISISCIMWWTHHYIWFLKWNQSTQFDAHGKDKKRERTLCICCVIFLTYFHDLYYLYLSLRHVSSMYWVNWLNCVVVQMCGRLRIIQNYYISIHLSFEKEDAIFLEYSFLFGQTREYTLIIVICLDSSTIISDPYLYIYSLVNELICLHNVRKLGFFSLVVELSSLFGLILGLLFGISTKLDSLIGLMKECILQNSLFPTSQLELLRFQ